MAGTSKYSMATIRAAQKMRRQGMNKSQISLKTGMSTEAIYYHTNKGAKEKRKASTYRWRERNRDKNLKSMREYAAKKVINK